MAIDDRKTEVPSPQQRGRATQTVGAVETFGKCDGQLWDQVFAQLSLGDKQEHERLLCKRTAIPAQLILWNLARFHRRRQFQTGQV